MFSLSVRASAHPTKGSVSSISSSITAPVTASRLRSLLTRRPSASDPPGVCLGLSSWPRVIRSVPSASTSRRQVCLSDALLPSPPPTRAQWSPLSACLSRRVCPIQPHQNRCTLQEDECMLTVTTTGGMLCTRLLSASWPYWAV